ncbi:HNH/ENDO VII family nuclease [Gordonia sp. DT101]|uniref:HNH/ENDO VII family nuclease n=1 Tax=Gordonia sp. DT101 TaxID=3416545 RepID=UPI003CF6BA33
MSPPIHFKNGVFQDATDDLADRRSEITGALDKLQGVIRGSGGCAGTDTNGQKFAPNYDAAQNSALDSGGAIAMALGNLHDLLQQTAFNHREANNTSAVAEEPDRAIPDWAAQTYYLHDAPSCLGGDSSPGWWSMIAAHVGGRLWPNAKTSELMTLSTGWSDAAGTFDAVAGELDGTHSRISGQSLPEAAKIAANVQNVQNTLRAVAGNFRKLSDGCRDYADKVDHAHHELKHQVANLLLAAGLVLAGGLVLSLFTLGGGAAAGGGGEAAIVAVAATRAVSILDALTVAAGAGAVMAGPTLAQDFGNTKSALDDLLNAKPVEIAMREPRPDLMRRPYIRKGVRQKVDQNAPKTADGRYIDPNTRQPIEGKPDLGHKPGHEWWRIRDMARLRRWTREQLNDYVNNPDLYRYEDPASNRSHTNEMPRSQWPKPK